MIPPLRWINFPRKTWVNFDYKSIINCPEYQLVLELRYLCFKSWEEIALQMGYDVRHVFRLHGEALKAISDLE